VAEDVRIEAGERGTEDRCAVDAARERPVRELAGVLDERASWAAQVAALPGLGFGPRPAAGLAEEGVCFLVELAGLPGVRVRLGQDVEGVLAQRLGDAGRVSQADRTFARGQELFQQVVHGLVARGAGEDALPATDRLTDQTDDRGWFAGPGRAVDDGEIFRGQGECDGLVLRVVQVCVQSLRLESRL